MSFTLLHVRESVFASVLGSSVLGLAELISSSSKLNTFPEFRVEDGRVEDGVRFGLRFGLPMRCGVPRRFGKVFGGRSS